MAKPAQTVHLKEFAADHGVDIRTVTNWLNDGLPYRDENGERRIVRADGNKWLIKRAEKKSAVKDGMLDKDQEQALKIRVEREIREVELQERLRSVVPVEELDALTERLVGGFAAVSASQLSTFERDMNLPPGDARLLTQRMHKALMEGAQQLANQLDEDAAEIEALIERETEVPAEPVVEDAA